MGKKLFFYSLVFLCSSVSVIAQLITSTNLPVVTLVQNELVTNTDATNITYNGTVSQIGQFNSSNANVGIEKGILLSTHPIEQAAGPNNSGSAGGAVLGGLVGDVDLAAIANTTTAQIYDVASLEFDFVANSNEISFSFVFASEEYLEYVNANVNDAFGFFISGPGINGPFSDNSVNLALVPGTNIPVTIDNINAASNAQYYVDNGNGTSAPFNASDNYVQYDGMTTKMTINRSVECGETYHIKIAIADVGDPLYGSGVFVESGAFSSTNPLTYTTSLQGVNCSGDVTGSIAISAQGGIQPYEYSIDGGLNYSSDYSFFNLGEGSYEVQVRDSSGCPVTGDTPLEITAQNELEMEVLTDDVSCYGKSDGALNVNVLQGNPPYTLMLNGQSITSGSSFVSSQPAGYYTLELIDNNGCKAVELAVIEEPAELLMDLTPENCYAVNEQVQLVSNTYGGTGNYSYAWSTGDLTSSTTITASANATYQLTVTDENGCKVRKTTAIKLSPEASFTGSVLQACENTEIFFENSSQNLGQLNTCLWSIGGAEVTNDCTESVSQFFSQDGLFDVSLTVVSDNDCSHQITAENFIEIIPIPTADFSFVPNTDIDVFQNSVLFYNNSVDADIYSWTINGDPHTSSSLTSQKYSFEGPGAYEVCLEAVSGKLGCKSEYCETIQVNDVFNVNVPNAFTPNDNNLNEIFKPKVFGASEEDYQFTIFTRWGDIAFSTSDINQGWDGLKEGNQVEQGVYSYSLVVRSKQDYALHTFNGHVTVLR